MFLRRQNQSQILLIEEDQCRDLKKVHGIINTSSGKKIQKHLKRNFGLVLDGQRSKDGTYYVSYYILCYGIIDKFPLMNKYLTVDADILHSPHFEKAIVKVIHFSNFTNYIFKSLGYQSRREQFNKRRESFNQSIHQRSRSR